MTITTPKRFTIAEYHRLIELGFFQENECVELIRGEIIQMAAKGIRHTVCCSRLISKLAILLGKQAILRCQDAILLPSGSEPEPDFAIVKNQEDDYLSSHPTPKDILLVIEIADSSLDYDREFKGCLYAEAGIENYWIFNLQDNQLETYCHAYQKISGSFDYSQKRVFLPHQTVNLPGFDNLVLDLSSIFRAIENTI